ncbi:MAG: DNA repair protein RecO [Colwellia sp.]|nr:DNA repair protein RecO [Colwellia sp.]MCW9080800.1 DNA repair protein RecO [Colwellia sp.]
MSNNLLEQSAYVLHSRPFQENQQLVELLTEHNGKVSALVYVGQSKRSIKKGLIQPFLPLRLILKEQGSSLKRIISVEASAKSYPLSKSSLYSAFYINELLVRLLNDDIVCESLFAHYQHAISALSQDLPIAAQLRKFELSLLDELGLSFDFEPIYTDNSDKVVGFYFVAEQGFMPAYKYAINHITTPYFSTDHLQAIAAYIHHEKPIHNVEIENTFKLLMRSVIDHLLDGKPLNSRKLYSSQIKKKFNAD